MKAIDRTAIGKVRIEKAQNDFAYWQSKPYNKRLAILEIIAAEYINWKYGI